MTSSFLQLSSEKIAMLTPLVALVRNVPLERKILFHIMFPSYEKRPKPIVFGKSPGKGLALPGDSAELLVASAAGRTASSGLFLRFAGRAASGGSLSRLVRCTAGGGFIGRTAGRTSPAGQIGKRHDVYLRLCLSNIFRSQTYLSVASVLKQVRTFLLLSHFFVTYCINFNFAL